MDSGFWETDKRRFAEDSKTTANAVAMAITRAEQGQMSEEDAYTLRSALAHLAPSSPTWKKAVNALRKGRPSGDSIIPGSYGPDPRHIPGMMDDPAMRTTTGRGFWESGDISGLGVDWNRPNPAAEHDMAGDSSAGEPPTPDGADLARVGVPDNPYGSSGFDDAILSVPGGMSISDLNTYGMDTLASNPSLFAQELAQDRGGGTFMTQFMEPRAAAALAMATTGMLGYDTGGAGLDAGPSSDTYKMMAAEQFLEEAMRTGNFVDPSVLYQEAFQRAEGTNWDTQTTDGKPLAPEQIIETTNAALMQVAPFMSDEAQAWMSSQLNAAARDYILLMSKGQTDLSYPAYLRSIGIHEMLGTQ